MLGWLLRLVLVVMAARFMARALHRNAPPPRPFDPETAAGREKPRATPPYESAGIEDAEFEDLPRR